MSKKKLTKMAQFSILSLLAVILAFWPAGRAGQAAEPAGGAAPVAASPGAAALEKAAKDNKYLFIFFYAGQDTETGAMYGVFQTAMAKMVDRADSMAIYVADPAEKPMVDKFGVRGAPMPLALAIAPTGAATRAFPKKFDEAQLRQAFVSPCTAKCIRVIQDRHTILLCVQSGKTQFNQEAMQGAEAFQADPRYARGTEIVVLNPTDEAEQQFLKALQVDPQTPSAVTLLVPPPGAPVARFVGAVTKGQIETAVKQAASSCGPNCSCHH
jgi:hypothetical protein